MTKDEKEQWIVDRFIEFYQSKKALVLKDIRKIPQEVSPGPDFLVDFIDGTKIGVEVTELLDFPSTITGQQREMGKKFMALLEKQIDADKFCSYHVTFYDTAYPTNDEGLKGHVDDIIKALYALDLSEVKNRKRIRIRVNGQKFMISRGRDSSQNIFASFIFGEDGVTGLDRENWFTALRKRLEDKEEKANKYLADQPNFLVVYDNTDYGIFLNDVGGEVLNELPDLHSQKFYEIWLLKGEGIYKLNND